MSNFNLKDFEGIEYLNADAVIATMCTKFIDINTKFRITDQAPEGWSSWFRTSTYYDEDVRIFVSSYKRSSKEHNDYMKERYRSWVEPKYRKLVDLVMGKTVSKEVKDSLLYETKMRGVFKDRSLAVDVTHLPNEIIHKVFCNSPGNEWCVVAYPARLFENKDHLFSTYTDLEKVFEKRFFGWELGGGIKALKKISHQILTGTEETVIGNDHLSLPWDEEEYKIREKEKAEQIVYDMMSIFNSFVTEPVLSEPVLSYTGILNPKKVH